MLLPQQLVVSYLIVSPLCIDNSKRNYRFRRRKLTRAQCSMLASAMFIANYRDKYRKIASDRTLTFCRFASNRMGLLKNGQNDKINDRSSFFNSFLFFSFFLFFFFFLHLYERGQRNGTRTYIYFFFIFQTS